MQPPGFAMQAMSALDRRVSVAPMMDRTDRHDRYFLRQISPSTLLYTEMTTTGALLRGDRERFLRFDRTERPLALQLGGSDPGELARCAEMAASRGYDEVNLNVGCPSDRVRNARFGACLMKEPRTVAACIRAMRSAVGIPVTVKTRIGVDEKDSWDDFRSFVETVAEGGCRVFGPTGQGAFLRRLGIAARTRRLAAAAPAAREAMARLVSKRAMGEHFQAMAVLPPDSAAPDGFAPAVP